MGRIGNSRGASSVAFDLGVLYKCEINDWEGAGWSVGLHVSNLGPKINYLTSKMLFLQRLKWEVLLTCLLQMHKLTLTADLGYRLSPADVQALSVSAGAEYAWRELVMLRGGYHCGDKKKGDASYATAGAGVEYAGVRLDLHGCLQGMNTLPEIRSGCL